MGRVWLVSPALPAPLLRRRIPGCCFPALSLLVPCAILPKHWGVNVALMGQQGLQAHSCLPPDKCALSCPGYILDLKFVFRCTKISQDIFFFLCFHKNGESLLFAPPGVEVQPFLSCVYISELLPDRASQFWDARNRLWESYLVFGFILKIAQLRCIKNLWLWDTAHTQNSHLKLLSKLIL